MVVLDLKLFGFIFNVVIGVYGKGGFWNKMEEVLDVMIVVGYIFDIFIYNIMIDLYGKGF